MPWVLVGSVAAVAAGVLGWGSSKAIDSTGNTALKVAAGAAILLFVAKKTKLI